MLMVIMDLRKTFSYFSFRPILSSILSLAVIFFFPLFLSLRNTTSHHKLTLPRDPYTLTTTNQARTHHSLPFIFFLTKHFPGAQSQTKGQFDQLQYLYRSKNLKLIVQEMCLKTTQIPSVFLQFALKYFKSIFALN